MHVCVSVYLKARGSLQIHSTLLSVNTPHNNHLSLCKCDILKQVYAGAVVVEYASTTWDTASKTNKSKLDRVQNMGLRIILGALRSTPIQEMEKTTDLQPLECRREYKAAIQGEN